MFFRIEDKLEEAISRQSRADKNINHHACGVIEDLHWQRSELLFLAGDNWRLAGRCLPLSSPTMLAPKVWPPQYQACCAVGEASGAMEKAKAAPPPDEILQLSNGRRCPLSELPRIEWAARHR